MKGLCVIILLITITCIVLTIQKKYIIESFISNSDYQKAKQAWDVCLKLPQNMRLLNKKCLTARKILDNASKKSNRSQKLSIEFMEKNVENFSIHSANFWVRRKFA